MVGVLRTTGMTGVRRYKQVTGLDYLKEEMLKRGYTKQQTESKTVLAVLEILSESNGRYSDMNRLENEIKDLERKKANLESTIAEYERKARICRSDLESIVQTINAEADKKYKAQKEYIDSFFKALDECETQEARDALKTAQMFVNTVDVNTKYDNTAYIIGLASILSQGKTASIDELRKINSKIPKFELQAIPGVKYGSGLKEYRVTNDEDKWTVL